jgi:methyl-accepting chemotaxis protein
MKLTVGKKLGFGFGAVLLLVAFGAVLGYVKTSTVEKLEETFVTVRIPTISALKDLQRDLNQSQSKGRQVVLAGTDQKRRDDAQRAFDTDWGEINKDVSTLDSLAPRWPVQANRERLAQLKEQIPPLKEVQEAAMKLAASGGADAVVKGGNEFADKATAAAEDIKKSLDGIADSNAERLQIEQKAMAEANSELFWTLMITSAASLIVGIFVALSLGRNIGSGTRAALDRANAIASGDLTGDEIKITSSDEIGELSVAINKMQASLRSIIESVLTSTEHLASASEEISASATQQAAGSDTQKDQTHQVATAMTEMSSTVVQISENSSKAAEAARKASETAKEGGKIVEQTLAKMREIAN